jgi:hypothetical protein
VSDWFAIATLPRRKSTPRRNQAGPRDAAGRAALRRAAQAPPNQPADRHLEHPRLRGLTEKWSSGSNDSPKRNLADVCAIAEIASRFDVLAVQETRDDLSALHRLLERLGSSWSFIITDVGEGQPASSTAT